MNDQDSLPVQVYGSGETRTLFKKLSRLIDIPRLGFKTLKTIPVQAISRCSAHTS